MPTLAPSTLRASFVLCASVGASLLSSGALGDATLGVPMTAAILRSTEGDTFAFRANKAYTGRPDGFYEAYFVGTEVVVYDRDYSDVEVTFVSDCRNYEGGRFTAHLTCRGVYDNAHDRWVATLDAQACTSTDPSYATSFNFNPAGLPNAWYFQGRTGYYQSQACEPVVALRVNGGRWLVDPVNGSHDFRPQLDSGWTPAAQIPKP